MGDMCLQKKDCRCLGIDFGERRIGIAISDERCIMARPYATIDTRKNDPIHAIKKIVEENNVCFIVIGNPLHLSGDESELSIKVKEFKRQLEEMLNGIEIVLYDERFTSKIAERMLLNRKVDVRKSKEQVDMYAAAFLLDEYLDSHKK